MARLVPRVDGAPERCADRLPAPMRMTMPARWRDAGLLEFAGVVLFRRRFGLPRRIDDFERVWLTCEGVAGMSAWRLNGMLLGRFDSNVSIVEFEITDQLRKRNELTVEIESPGDAGGLWGEVALEIRCRAYLRNVRVMPERGDECSRLRVCGEVAGESDGPLELYVLIDSRTVGYRPCRTGETFEIATDELSAEAASVPTVRVDLVQGAVVWFTIEVNVAMPGL